MTSEHSPAALIDRASVFHAAQVADIAVEAAEAAAAHPDATPPQIARALQIAAWGHLLDEDGDAATEAQRGRIIALRDAGDVVQADYEERVGLVAFGWAENHDLLATELATLPPGATRADVAVTLAATVDDGATAVELLLGAVEDAKDTPGLASFAQTLLADALMETDLDAAIALLDSAVSTAVEPGDRIDALMSRARLAILTGAFDAGAADADEATGLYFRFKCHRGVALGATLASELLELGDDIDEAVERARTAVRASERANDGEEDADLARVLFQLGFVLAEADRAAEAVPVLRRAADIEAVVLADDPESRAVTLLALGDALVDTEAVPEALVILDQAAGLYREAGDDYSLGVTLFRRGELLVATGAHTDARTSLEDALSAIGDEDPDTSAEIREALAQLPTAQP